MKITALPCTSQFEVDALPQYQNWLRADHPRELAYRLALENIAKRRPNIKRILDVGTGTGVWAIAAADIFRDAHIDAIDIHAENITTAKNNAECFPALAPKIDFFVANANDYKPSAPYDLIITELDAGVGNNEAAKRAFNHLSELLNKDGEIIPATIEVYIASVNLPDVNETLPNTEASPLLRGHNIVISDPYSCHYYVYGAEKKYLLSEPQLLDTLHGTGGNTEGFTRELSFSMQADGNLTGFLVWFRHQLTEGVVMTSAPDSPITSWGQSYFPVRAIPVAQKDTIVVSFSERMTERGALPYYEWNFAKNGEPMQKYSNLENQRRWV